MKRSFGTLLFCILLSSCGGDDIANPPVADGLALNTASNALASIQSLVAGRGRAGVATDYCDANGTPIEDGAEMASTSDSYPGAIGFCQITHNSQSSYNARGEMYILGAMACEANQLKLFDNLTIGTANTQTDVTISLSTTCWGTQAEVDAFAAEIGATTFTAQSLSVTQLAADAAYDYQIVFGTDFRGERDFRSAYISNSNNVIAALGKDWAFKFDTSTGVFIYEGVNNTLVRRLRFMVSGSVANHHYTEVSAIKGFWYGSTNSLGPWAYGVTFSGSPTLGLMGDTVTRGAGVTTDDKCYLPGSTGTCSGLTAPAITEAQFESLYHFRINAGLNLSQFTSALISFTDIDPADWDITD